MGEVAMGAEGGFVGNGVGVGSMTGIGVAVQAVRRRKAAMMSFFIAGNYMPRCHGEECNAKQSPAGEL